MTLSTENVSTENQLTQYEAITTIWKWRKYRNQVFYQTIYRWGALSIGLTMVPYLIPDIIGKLGYAVFIFPFFAFLLFMVAAYLIAVQYKLYKQVDRVFRRLLGSNNPADVSNDTLFNKIMRKISLGKIFTLIFLFFGIFGELINVIFLLFLVARHPA